MDNNKTAPPFAITLKPNNAKPAYVVSVLVLALSYFSFLYKAFAQYNLAEMVVFVVMAMVSGVWYFNILKQKWPAKHGYIIFLLAGAAWYYQGGIGYAVGVLVMFSGIVQSRIKQLPVIIVNNDGITLKNIFVKRYNWQQINNVLIKDGLVTVDCKNNRLYQKEVGDEICPRYEAEFNEFCSFKTPSAQPPSPKGG